MAETPKNDNDLLRMQQDAIRRVRMMQQRAQQSVEAEPAHDRALHRDSVPDAARTDPAPKPHSPAENTVRTSARTGTGSFPAHARTQHSPRTPPQEKHPRYAAHPRQNPLAALFSSSSHQGTGDSLLSSLFDGDSERTMLLVLLLILVDDRTDMSLILALLYLIL